MSTTYLSHCHFKVLLGDVYPSFPEGIHPCLGTHPLDLCPRGTGHGLCYLTKVDASSEVHLARMDTKNVQTSLKKYICISSKTVFLAQHN